MNIRVSLDMDRVEISLLLSAQIRLKQIIEYVKKWIRVFSDTPVTFVGTFRPTVK